MRAMSVRMVCVGLIVIASACSSDSDRGSAATAAPISAAPADSTAPVSSLPPTTVVVTTVAATTVPATTVPATTGPATRSDACKVAALQMTLGPGDAAAGNQYTPIVFTNIGATPCTLDGHPGVSFVDGAGAQVGESATRTGGPTALVTLAVGGQAYALMDYHDPGLFDGCAPAATTSLKVYPPDEYDAITIAFPSSLCTLPTIQPELTIDIVKAGTGP